MKTLVFLYGVYNMKIKEIKTIKSPKAIGPYSQGILFNNLIFTSGQIPLNPQTGQLVKNDIHKEIMQVLKNINNILIEGGSSMDNVIKVTVYLTNLNLFSTLNEVFESVFNKYPQPARSTVEVSSLPLGARVEIEAIGMIDE